jgi:prepilin-type N-terminal cleavage/methylation domain-containing protein
MMSFRSITQSRGYTIVEVMIALAVFSVGFLAYSGLQLSSSKGNLKSRWLTQAATYATDRIEMLLDLPFTDDDLAAGTHSPPDESDGIDNDNDGRVDEAGESGPLDISWTVTDDAPIMNVKTIDITITWTDPFRQNAISVEYYKADL